MYTIEVVTAPSQEPVTVAELKAHLRINDNSEDDLILGFIKTAREFFEALTLRPVMPTVFRQHVQALNRPVYLMRGNVTSIDSLKYYDTSGTLVTATGYRTDSISTPAQVWFDTYPTTSSKKSPVAYVQFTAGWTTVPEMARTAIRLLSAHYYENRNSHEQVELKDVPMGFQAVCNQFKCGFMGDWGQV